MKSLTIAGKRSRKESANPLRIDRTAQCHEQWRRPGSVKCCSRLPVSDTDLLSFILGEKNQHACRTVRFYRSFFSNCGSLDLVTRRHCSPMLRFDDAGALEPVRQ